MSAIKAGGGSEGMKPVAVVVGIILLILALGVVYYLSPGVAFMGLLGVVIGGLLIGFGVHFVPVGGAPAAMGQSPGIATGVTMLAAGAGLAGLFGGAWAAEYGLAVALAGGAIGGGLMMAITCLMVNIIYVYAMGIPAASGKVANDPITGDTFEAYKSQGTEGHGLPFISYVGGVIGGILGGLGGTLIYLELLEVYETFLPTLLNASPDEVKALAVGLAGIFAIGMFLVNAVIAAYNITGTIEGPHDPKFKRFPRAVIGCAVASAVCGVLAIFVVLV